MQSNADLNHQVADLRGQVAEFTLLCTQLTVQVENLKDLLEKQSCKNLLQLQEVGTGKATRTNFRPTQDMVGHQVNHVCQWNDDTLAQLAMGGDTYAQRERLIREIMQVDGCSWDRAHDKLIEMDEFNEQRYMAYTLPYRIGVSAALLAAIGSVLMVFQRSCAQLYGEKVAGEELPEGVKDTSEMTINQVGTWTWSWMEPMIGTASFVLLCLQFARAQSVKMNLRPYTETMLRWRANRVASQYPQYDGSMVRVWSRDLPVVNWNFNPMYKRHMYTLEQRSRNFRGEY